MRVFSASGSAQSQEPSQSQNERVLENGIPKHVPLKIRIKKEKEESFKDLKNTRWIRDFELEVTNTGDKPIYSLSLMLITDVKAAAGYPIWFSLNYGSSELGDYRVKAQPSDIPISPGETYVFTIHPGERRAWERLKPLENRPDPKKIEVKFEGLSFGDGTGLVGEGGAAVPRIRNATSLNRCQPQKKSEPTLLSDRRFLKSLKSTKSSGMSRYERQIQHNLCG